MTNSTIQTQDSEVPDLPLNITSIQFIISSLPQPPMLTDLRKSKTQCHQYIDNTSFQIYGRYHPTTSYINHGDKAAPAEPQMRTSMAEKEFLFPVILRWTRKK